jgi:hypothetical protein
MKTTEKAYIAGFLDGDGSIHIRLKPNETYRFGFQVAPSIVFYQSSKEIYFLNDLKKLLNIGYIRERNDGIVEYIIGDTESMLYLIDSILPYLRLKKEQAKLFQEIFCIKKSIKSAKEFYSMCKKIDSFEKLNYSKNRKQNSQKVKEYLLKKGLLTP